MAGVDIFQYYDYQKYLDDYYHARKASNPFFSYRYISQKVGLDHALVIRILKGKRHISPKSIILFVKLLNLKKKEADYFELLVYYGKAKSDGEKKHYFEKILKFQSIPSRLIDADRYEFYQKWYYTAVREVLHLIHFTNDYQLLAKVITPNITPAEAKKAVTLLLRLGMIRKNKNDIHELTDSFITTGEAWQSHAIRSFQKSTMALAIEALETIPPGHRDISTVTLTLDEEGFAELRESVRLFQKNLFNLAASRSKVSRVYQINLQVFPLSNTVLGETKEGFHA